MSIPGAHLLETPIKPSGTGTENLHFNKLTSDSGKLVCRSHSEKELIETFLILSILLQK